MDSVTLLVRLHASARDREAFAEDREAWLDSVDADDEARALFCAVGLDALVRSGQAQLHARRVAVACALPRTARCLGRRFDTFFDAYASRCWPHGPNRELDDAWRFAEYLKAREPDAVSGEDRALLKARRSLILGRTLSFSVSHHHDDGWLSSLSLVRVDGESPSRLRLPLPLPSWVVRRAFWRSRGDEEG